MTVLVWLRKNLFWVGKRREEVLLPRKNKEPPRVPAVVRK